MVKKVLGKGIDKTFEDFMARFKDADLNTFFIFAAIVAVFAIGVYALFSPEGKSAMQGNPACGMIVIAADGQSLASNVAPSLNEARNFLVVNPLNGRMVESIKNPYRGPDPNDQIVYLVASKGEEAVIVGNIDKHSYDILMQFGIRVFGGYQGRAQKVVKLYRQARISVSPLPDANAQAPNMQVAMNNPNCPIPGNVRAAAMQPAIHAPDPNVPDRNNNSFWPEGLWAAQKTPPQNQNFQYNSQPNNYQPVAAQPVAMQPVAMQPVVMQPVMMQPVMMQPVTMQPVAMQQVAMANNQGPSQFQIYQNQFAQNQNPQYQGQQYQGPQYQGPQYQGPQYQGQQYQGQQYQGQQYQGPQYQGPGYQGPQYNAQNNGNFGNQVAMTQPMANAPPIMKGATMPHAFRGECTNCHQILDMQAGPQNAQAGQDPNSARIVIGAGK